METEGEYPPLAKGERVVLHPQFRPKRPKPGSSDRYAITLGPQRGNLVRVRREGVKDPATFSVSFVRRVPYPEWET